jgi:hypothetical protein
MVVLLVPVICLLSKSWEQGGVTSWIAIGMFVVINGLALWQKAIGSQEVEFLWLAPVLAVVYLIAGGTRPAETARSSPG